jgi:hypothetical protein
MKKWNMTINYTIHWAELDDSQILKLESKDKVKTLKPMEGRNRNYNRMIKIEDKAEHWVHVIFPETDKHYEQSFNSKDLIIVI